MVALVALRIGIGFHFYKEGADKIRAPQPYSAAFFSAAKGPLVPWFRGLVWDADGLARLDAQETITRWDHFKERAIGKYQLDAEQAKEAQRIFQRRRGQLEWWLKGNAADIEEYRKGLERRDRYHADAERMQVASLRGQVNQLEAELAQQRRELIAPIELLWEGYARDLHQLAGRPADEKLSIPRPGRRWLDSESIDSVIRYFDVTVGALLILGLFTRVAATLGAAFLGSVIASQWPGTAGAIPVWPQFIEMLGLVVLAATGAGRFAGLDYLVGSLRRWCCPPKNQGIES